MCVCHFRAADRQKMIPETITFRCKDAALVTEKLNLIAVNLLKSAQQTFYEAKCLRLGTYLPVQNSSLMCHLMHNSLLLETWTSSVTLKTPDATKLSWNSGPSVET